jgi:acetyl-CoA carboxylase carboxyltransferase component
MTWEAEVAELRRRQAMVAEMGGKDRVERQHQAGRLTVRERVDRMLDPGSFREVGSVSGFAEYDADQTLKAFHASNCVVGRGTVDGRPVMIAGDDFTLRGGSAEAAIWPKLRMSETLATEFRLPLIRMIEGSGGGGSVRSIEKSGRASLPGGVGGSSGVHLLAATLTEVPVVGLALGSVAGLGAARLAATHFSVMVKDKAAVFVAGPPVVERLGEKRTKQELGGHKVQLEAGTVDMAAETEEEAFALARRFLSYLPSSVHDLPARGDPAADATSDVEKLISIVPRDPRRAYPMRRIIEAVVDPGSFFEIGARFGRPIIAGLARLDGWPVAIMAGDPVQGGGAWDAAAAQKIARFVDLAETFHLPIVHLVDCPGFQIGLAAEQSGLMRHAVRAVSAINQSTVPWCSVIVRNCFGIGGAAHQPQRGRTFRYAWPSARWGSLPLAGGIEAAYRAELDAAEDKEAAIAEIEARLTALGSPFRSAEAFLVEEMIDPRETRRLLCEFAHIAAPLRSAGPARFTTRP